jgi:hypothetical protein
MLNYGLEAHQTNDSGEYQPRINLLHPLHVFLPFNLSSHSCCRLESVLKLFPPTYDLL